jgi:hypothetical protein
VDQAQDDTQVVCDLFEDAGLYPPPDLLVSDRPIRKVMRQHAPLAAGFDGVANRVENFPQVVRALRSVFAHKRQVGEQKFPFRIRNVTRIGLSSGIHPLRCMRSCA